MVNKIINIMQNSEYEFFGLRKDDFNYNIGDICNNSHDLFQDPIYDDDGELLYSYCENGIYKGYYDAGELNGTSAVEILADESEINIIKKIDKMSMYLGDHLYLIAGNDFTHGNDNGEIIINDANVVFEIK